MLRVILGITLLISFGITLVEARKGQASRKASRAAIVVTPQRHWSQDVYRPGRRWSDDVYVGMQRIGRDPDPFIRGSLLREWNWRYGG